MDRGNILNSLNAMISLGPNSENAYGSVQSMAHEWVNMLLYKVEPGVSDFDIDKLKQICSGLSYLHDVGIVHGDLRGVSVYNVPLHRFNYSILTIIPVQCPY